VPEAFSLRVGRPCSEQARSPARWAVAPSSWAATLLPRQARETLAVASRDALKPLLRTAYRSLRWMRTDRTPAVAEDYRNWVAPIGGERRRTEHAVGAVNSVLRRDCSGAAAAVSSNSRRRWVQAAGRGERHTGAL